jgi:chitinase
MFGGSQAADQKDWLKKSADEQLQTTKTMGMVFEYMNAPDVWEKFCDTYEAIYNRLGEFDDYHARKNSGFPKLQDEWSKYIDVVLSSMANRSKGTLSWMFQQRAYVLHSQSSVLTP